MLDDNMPACHRHFVLTLLEGRLQIIIANGKKLKSNKIILPKSSPNKLFRFDIFLEILQQHTKWNNHQGQVEKWLQYI